MTGLAVRLGYSRRQVERSVAAELGAGPLALARAGRAQTARLLIETTLLPIAEVAQARPSPFPTHCYYCSTSFEHGQ